MKSLVRVVLVLLAVWLHSGAASADQLGDIQDRGTLRVGISEFMPWTFRNRAGELEGFEIDVAQRIADDMGVNPDFRVYALHDLFGAIERGEIDFIAAGLAITPARAMVVEFSSPYFESGTTLVVNSKLAPGVDSVEALNRKGRVVITVADSFSSEIAPMLFDEAEIKQAADEAAAEEELITGRAHGGVTNLAEAHYLAAKHPGVIETPLAVPLVRSVAGFGVKRGNQALLNFLNAWIASRNADSWLPSTYDYWFSGSEWIVNAVDN